MKSGLGIAIIVVAALLTAVAKSEMAALSDGPDSAQADSTTQPSGMTDSGFAWLPLLSEGEGTANWSATADALILQRSTPSSRTLATNLLGSSELLNTGDLDSDFQGGPRLGLVYHGECFNIEGNFFRIDGWQGSATANAGVVLGNDLYGFSLPTVSILGDQAQIDASYSSLIRSWELNVRKNIHPRVQLLAGFRYVAVEEDFNFRQGLQSIPGLFRFGTETENNLYGGQLGVDATLWARGRLKLDGIAKLGIFANDAQQISSAQIPLVGGFNSNVRSTSCAFVGDFAFTGSIRINPYLTLRAGYQLLCVEGVALATEQMDSNNFVTPTSGIDASGGLFYHGPTAGLQLCW